MRTYRDESVTPLVGLNIGKPFAALTGGADGGGDEGRVPSGLCFAMVAISLPRCLRGVCATISQLDSHVQDSTNNTFENERVCCLLWAEGHAVTCRGVIAVSGVWSFHSSLNVIVCWVLH